MELLSSYINHQVDNIYWDLVTLSRYSPPQLHLFFADDLTLISKANMKSIHTIHNCMNRFCVLSDQKINAAKSKAIFSKYFSKYIVSFITY